MKKLTLIVTILIFVFIGSGCNSFQSMEHSKTEYSNSKDDFSLSDDGCLVLNYHRIRSPDWFTKTLEKLTHNTELTTYSVYTNEFKKQILYLKEKGIPFITPADLETYVSGEKPMPKKCALITFDDIDVSVYEHAYPFLKEENIPFTVFIITGQVGNPDFDGLKMVTWKQLEEMNRSGLATIGTHTHKLHYIEPNEKAPFLKEKKFEFV
ncbi:polysaccharide deacetylase family protein [Ectobacillus funiculus]